MRLGGCNRAYCKIRKARQYTVPRSLIRVGAWRAQVHWVDYAWRVSCYSCIPTYCLVIDLPLGGRRRGFSLSSSVSSSITYRGVILCLHSLFLYSCALLLLFVVHVYALEQLSVYCASFTLVPHLDKLKLKQSCCNFKLGV